MSKIEEKVVPCYMCWQNCGIKLQVQDGVVIGAIGNPDAPIGGGFTCERVASIPEFHDGDSRLNYPLKRVGERGAGKWNRITWEQALDEIAEKLLKIKAEYGTEAVCTIGGTVHEPSDWSAWRFANYWGTPNIFNQGKNCGTVAQIYEVAMFGWDSLGAAPEPGITKTIVSWGANHAESNNTKWNTTQYAMRLGAKLIVVDPRYTETASKADLWIKIRQGTDGAFGWGVINYMIQEGLYDKEFVQNWTTGFDQVVEHVKEYPLDKVSAITGVPEWQIIQFAKMYANGPTCSLWALATCHLGPAGQSAAHAQMMLKALNGDLDSRGGNPQTGPHRFLDYFDLMGYRHLMENTSLRDCVSAEKVPICSLESFRFVNKSVEKAWGEGYGASQYFLFPAIRGIIDAMIDGTPYPIKALFIQAGNPLTTISNAKHFYEGMKHLDLAVGMDFYMTPSLAMCDYVLPAASFIERPHLMIFWGVTNSTMAWKQPMEPLYERKDDYYLWTELARRTNTIGEWPETLEGMYDLFLHKTEFTHKELASSDDYWLFPNDMMYHRYEKYGFGTPSGKAELVPSAFKAAGIDPLPHYVEKSQSVISTPELAEEYPYSLISGCRVRPYWHTSLRQLKTLRWMHPYPLVEMHPVVARRHNIADGEWVFIETPLGRIKQVAKIMPGMQEDMINAEGYWYYPEKPEEEPYLLGVWDSNINAIISDEYEDCDFAGDNPFRACLCKIYKADTITNYDVPVAAKTLTASAGVAEIDLNDENKPTFTH